MATLTKHALRGGVLAATFALAGTLAICGFGLTTSAQQSPVSDRLYRAIRTNDLAQLRTLIAENASNVKDSLGLTPLILAAAFGTRDAVTMLLDAGADVKIASNAGLTALHLAWQDENIVRALLAHGADVNVRTQLGATPLMVAASANDTAGVVALLLNKGADPNISDSRGLTPLMMSARVGNRAAIKLLLERGADTGAIATGTASVTATSVMAAAWGGDAELLRMLLAAKPNLEVKGAPEGNVKNGPVEWSAFTALHLATTTGNTEVVKLLLDAGAVVDARDSRGLTPLMWAVGTDHPEPNIIRTLLDHGADVSIGSKTNETVRDWARKFNNPPVMSALKMQVNRAYENASKQPISTNIPTSREAVERSVPLLRTGSSRVMTDGGCVACHAQPLTAVAAEYASRRGWAERAASDVSQVVSSMTSTAAGLMQGREGGGLPDTVLFYGFMMAATNTAANVGTDALVYYLAASKLRTGGGAGSKTARPCKTATSRALLLRSAR